MLRGEIRGGGVEQGRVDRVSLLFLCRVALLPLRNACRTTVDSPFVRYFLRGLGKLTHAMRGGAVEMAYLGVSWGPAERVVRVFWYHAEYSSSTTRSLRKLECLRFGTSLFRAGSSFKDMLPAGCV